MESVSQRADTTGIWSCDTSGPVAVDSSITFTLVHDEDSGIALFDFADIGPDGVVRHAQILDGPDDFTGTFTIEVGSGPPEAIPVWLTSVDVTARSVLLFGIETGPNRIQLPPYADRIEGVYNAHEGTIHFDKAVRLVLSSSVVTVRVGVHFRPWITLAERCRVHPIATVVVSAE